MGRLVLSLLLLPVAAVAQDDDDTIIEDTAAEDEAAIRATQEEDAHREEVLQQNRAISAQQPPAEQPAEQPSEQGGEQPSAEVPQPAPFNGTAPPAAKVPRVHGTPTQLPDADDHVISQSGFFSVSGADALRLGAIASHADDVYHRLMTLLQLPPGFRSPISIRLIGKSSDAPQPHPVRTRIRIIDNSPSFQIRVYPGGGISLEQLDNAIITMVLYERALRSLDPGAFPDTVQLPDWLVTGIQQAMLWRSGKADRALYRNLFNRADMLSPEEMIAVEDPGVLDAASRQVYDVSCGVLVMALLTRNGGIDQLKTLLDEAATSDSSPKELIAAHFHELGLDKALLNKWWALQLADLALPRAQDALTPLESEKELSEALTIMWYDPETETPRPLSVDNVYELLKHEDWKKLIQPSIERLVALSTHCFPGYRPIVTEYCRVLADLSGGADPDSLQDSLGPLQELRRAYQSAAVRGRDYLDWYEINFLGEEKRRSFDSYLETLNLLRRDKPGAATPVSRYLDDIEALYQQKEGEELPAALRNQVPARDGQQAQN